MQRLQFLALLVSIGSGLAIGSQGTLNSRVGRLMGPLNAGLLVNLAGGVTAGLLFLFVVSKQGGPDSKAIRGAGLLVLVSGALGVVIITGISYSLSRIGVAAGLSSIILGQMLVAIIADGVGWGGGDPVPLTWPRIAGLTLLLLGTWLLLPRR